MNEKTQLSMMEIMLGVTMVAAGLYIIGRWLAANWGADIVLMLYALALALVVVAMALTRRL